MKNNQIIPKVPAPPSLDDAIKNLDIGNGPSRILADAIKEIFDNTNMNQRTVLTPKLGNALIRGEAYCRFFNDVEGLKLIEEIKEIVVSFGGKGRKDMREAISAALGIAIRSSSAPTDMQLGMKRDG